ncbi:MAG: helix-turn-helix domain-containing protein [Proteobacteria bacterium]|nr:helix-turn-helix domain-containing protein [Pseudomonadota bacterium]
MHVVAILAHDGVVPFDLATPCEVFGRARLADGQPAYEVRVCAESDDVDAGSFRLSAPWRLRSLLRADTVIVPGLADLAVPVSARAVRAVRLAAAAGARVASICTGAFILAETGLLDGFRATTHWLAAAEPARRYPAIDVDPEVLYVDNGDILTSAGAAAGLDLCLHLVRRDHGARVAADAARIAVMPLERGGGQAQFIVHEDPSPDGASLEPLLRWLERNAHRDLSLDDIAHRAAMSPRTLNRRFRDQTGTTPLQWLLRARTRRAQHLLETTAHSIEQIAGKVGFGSAAAFRARFQRVVGISPRAYRHAFRGAAPQRRKRNKAALCRG